MMEWREYRKLQRRVELGERFLSYVDEGRGEPLVLIHGIPTWGYLWSGLLAGLSQTHRVLVPDLLGFGFSDTRDGFQRGISRQADALEAWMERLSLRGATVVGHDIGGGVAQHLAVRYPERVGRLVLVNSISYDSWPIELMLQLGHPALARRLSVGSVQRLLRFALRLGAFATKPPRGFVSGLLAPYATEEGKRSLLRCAAALDTNQTMELVDRLPRLRVPTRVVWGVDDRFQRLAYGQRLAADIPGAQLVPIARARHFCMVDQPHAVAQALSFAPLGLAASGPTRGSAGPVAGHLPRPAPA